MNPLVSILITTYNQESYIAEAIEGALAQVIDFETEIIISDDASTDDTLRICQQYAGAYPDKIRLIARSENMGLVRNYYATLLTCRGKYIADCAGDDCWIVPDKLARQIALLESDPTLMLVHTNFEEFHQQEGVTRHDGRGLRQGNKASRVNWETGCDDLFNHKRCSVPFISSACYRTEIIKQTYDTDTDLFTNPLYTCEDVQLACVLLHKGDFAYIDQETTQYRMHETSASNSLSAAKNHTFYYGVLLVRLRLLEKYHLTHTSIAKRYLCRQFNRQLRIAFATEQRDNVIRIARKLIEWEHLLSLPQRLALRWVGSKVGYEVCQQARSLIIFFKKPRR